MYQALFSAAEQKSHLCICEKAKRTDLSVVFFLAGVMLMFIILSLLENLRKEKLGIPYAAILVVMGIANFLGQIPRLLMMITG